MFHRIFLALLVILSSLATVANSASALSLDWEAEDRFRVLGNNTQLKKLLDDVRRIANSPYYSPPIVPGRHERPTNYNTKWIEQQQQYQVSWVHEPSRDIRVFFTGGGVPRNSECLTAVRQKKAADMTPDEGWSKPEKQPCYKMIVNVNRDTAYQVRVNVSTLPQPLFADVFVQDVLVAVMGDSFASGEGNPHAKHKHYDPYSVSFFPAAWWDTRCHRSLASGPAQAAGMLAMARTKHTVTFISYACSGAEIKDGVLTRYSGRETVLQILKSWSDVSANAPVSLLAADPIPPLNSAYYVFGNARSPSSKLEPQIDKLAAALCTGDRPAPCEKEWERRPDILIISVGGNDIGFGEVASMLLTKTQSGDENKWLEAKKVDLQPHFKRLAGDFGELAAKVKTTIKPRHVLLMDYPDPTQGKDGKRCAARDTKRRFESQIRQKKNAFAVQGVVPSATSFGTTLFNLLLTSGETALAEWIVHELNRHVLDATSLQWRETNYADGTNAEQVFLASVGDKAGVCTQPTMFISITDSLDRQWWVHSDDTKELIYRSKLDPKKELTPGNTTSGVLHPNTSAHYTIAGRLKDKIDEMWPRIERR
jgi:hypothetical protein